MKAKKTMRGPLCKEAIAWRKAALEEFDFDLAELALLDAPAQLLSVYYSALGELQAQGFVLLGTRGPRVNPMATVSRQSLETFAKLARQLGIGGADKAKPGRPWAGEPVEMKGGRDGS